MLKLYAALLLVFGACMFNDAKSQSIINPADTIVNYTSTSNPKQPAYGTIGKWGRTPSLNWNTTEYKCYILNGFPIRIHFPKTYQPGVNDGKLYPALVFWHGLGEAGPVTDNEKSLYHGGQPFQTAVDNGTYDGYIIIMQSTGYFAPAHYQAMVQILNYMVTNNKLDPARVSVNGLSAGGQACWNFFQSYAPYCAAVLPMSAMDLAYEAPNIVNQLRWTPYWYFQGGKDTGPAPQTTAQVLPYFYNAGANFTYTLFPTQGHDTWDSAWLMPNFFPFIRAANAANPWALHGRTNFCPGNPIKQTIGVVPGENAYQWELNGTLIPSATADTLLVTQAGSYTCRFQNNNGVWSQWSPVPLVISVQASTQTPNITLVKPQSVAIPAPDGTTSVAMSLPTGDSTYSWWQVGASTVLSTTNTYTATKPGDYLANVIPKFGCAGIPSPSFEVINANGPNAPTAATNVVATAQSFTKVQLSWATQPNPTNAPTAFEVYRSTKANGPWTYLGQTQPTTLSWADSNLNAGTQYFYTIRSIDTSGAAPLATPGAVTTLKDNVPPSAPGNLTVVYTTNSSIGITWSLATDNVGVANYQIYVNGTLSNITSGNSFILNGLTQGQWYSIYVVAVDGSGNVSNPSNQVDAGAIYSGLVYKYYTSAFTPSSVSQISTMNLTETGMSPNTNINLYTNATQVNFAYVWTGYITIPVNGTYTFATSSDDGSELFFNSLTPTGTPTVNNDGAHGTTTKSSAALNLTKGTYPICIEYFQGGGGYAMTTMWASQQLNGNTTLVAIPNQYFAQTTTPPTTVPAKPTNIKATAVSYNQVNITWKDNSNNETGFEVYRATSPGGPFNIVATLPPGSTSLHDQNALNPATTYYYKVQAINAAGGSGYDSLSVGGLHYNVYSGAFGSPMPNFYTQTPVASGNINNITLSVAGTLTTNFGVLFSGIIKAPVTGTYTFSTTSDDASALYIGGYPSTTYRVVNNDFQQGATTRSGTISLTAGQYYPFYVAYDQGAGGFSLSAAWQLPGTSTAVAIPDSAFANQNWSAATLPLPAAPVTPTLTGSALSTSKIGLSWTDTSSNISGYTLNRSVGDSLHFQPLATFAAGTTSYQDNSLFGHQLYYYQLSANGPGGTSPNTPATGITTNDNYPVVSAIASQTIRYGTTVTINITATDADGDALVYSGVNLPPFATLTDNGNGTAVLSLSPSQAQANTYAGIGVAVSDGFGGVTQSLFNLTVNNNYPPVITTVSPVSINTGSSLSIPLTASSPSGDNMTFVVTGAPNNNTLVAGPNGSDTLKLNPTYGATGNYTVNVTVNDNQGGTTSSSFPLQVNFVNPVRKAYLRINAGDNIGSPWNNITGQVTSGILDANGTATNWTFNLNTNWWGGAALGPSTGNNSGVYPDAVLHDFYFFGDYGAPNTIAPTITGLDPTKLYSITLYAGSVFNDVANNGTTVYNSEGQTVSLYVQNNTTNTVSLSNLQPDSTGTITINMSKANDGTPIGYINALVISQIFNDGTAPQSPYNLIASLNNTGSGVVLNWSDSAYNETGYEIWRSLSASGPFTQVLPDPQAKATTFTDTTTAGYSTYFYKVRAVNGNGNSNYTNTVSISTPDKVPTLTQIPNISLNWATNDTVQVTASGSPGNPVTLVASGLPSFASFTDNGNGTGTLIISAPDSATGTYNSPVITMTDEADSVRTTAFSITVKNPQVSTVYLHFSDGVNNGASPWNNVVVAPAPGYSQSGLLNDAGTNSGLSLTYQNGFQGIIASGERPGNGAGIYPDPVMRSCLFDVASHTDSLLISGLNPGNRYSFVVFSSADWGVAGPTSFNILGQTQSINPAFNASNVLEFQNLTPRANGTVSVGVTKSSAAQYLYFNDLVIQGYSSSFALMGPSFLHTTQVTRNSVSLAWTDNAWNETGYEVWRATDGTNYTRIATLGANVTSYTNSGLNSNTTYYYTVRAVKNSLPSTYSNAIGATTTSYAIYLEFNEPNLNIAGLPWNSLNQEPVTGQTWSGFTDDQGNPTATGMVLNGLWAGMSNLGMNTGNNSGAVPDIVMADSYVLFAGQSGGFVLSGMNIGNSYDITFFGSINFQADASTTFTVNGKPVILNASLNTNGTVTIYGVRPDQNGNITINVNPTTANTEYGIVNAIIIRGYTPDANIVPAPPVTNAITQNPTQTMSNVTNDASAATVTLDKDTVITAYPNPFKESFTLQVPASRNGTRAMVQMFSDNGTNVYTNEFNNLAEGNNYLTIRPGASLMTGVYFVKVATNDGHVASKLIKVLKE